MCMEKNMKEKRKMKKESLVCFSFVFVPTLFLIFFCSIFIFFLITDIEDGGSKDVF